MEMRSARLDRRITIQRATYTQNGLGEQIPTWNTLATVWAEVMPVSDGERIRAMEVSAEITTRFRIRYSSTVASVNPKDRVAYDGRVYDIVGVKELGRRGGLEITANARADR